MAANQTTSNRAQRPDRAARGAVERLHAYWLTSTVLLLLITAVLAIYTRAALQRASDLGQRVAVLEQQALERSAAPLVETTATLPSVAPQPTPVRHATPIEVEQAPPVRVEPAAPVVEPPAGPREDDLRADVAALIAANPATTLAVTDRIRASELVQRVWESPAPSGWSGVTWAELAVLARLAQRDPAAVAFARRAADANAALTTYAEVSARSFLARRQPGEALPFAQQLVAATAGAPSAVVLLADALLADGQPAAACETLQELKTIDHLGVVDLLRLARVHMALEQWADLADAVNHVTSPPPELAAEYNFLYAVMQAQAEHAAEALMVLDALAADAPPPPRDDLPWPPPYPERYEILVWRGVALTYANQLNAAREALDEAARLDPGRPEAYYHRGILEAWDGKTEAATGYLKNALASSATMAPAWEALASLELDANAVDAALEHLAKAIAIDPYRPSAHYLVALAHAKLSQAEEAARALRRVFELDPGYLEEARQVEVFRRLFAPGELERLAAPPDAGERG